MIHISYKDLEEELPKLVERIRFDRSFGYYNLKGIYAHPRGGLPLGVHLSHHLNLPLYYDSKILMSKQNLIIADDISDTGETLKRILGYKDITGATFITCTIVHRVNSKVIPNYTIYKILPADPWVVFPWEGA